MLLNRVVTLRNFFADAQGLPLFLICYIIIHIIIIIYIAFSKNKLVSLEFGNSKTHLNVKGAAFQGLLHSALGAFSQVSQRQVGTADCVICVVGYTHWILIRKL